MFNFNISRLDTLDKLDKVWTVAASANLVDLDNLVLTTYIYMQEWKMAQPIVGLKSYKHYPLF